MRTLWARLLRWHRARRQRLDYERREKAYRRALADLAAKKRGPRLPLTWWEL